MGRHDSKQRGRPQAGWLSLTVTLGGRPRTYAPRPLACLILGIALPVLAVWYLGATLYFLFHDDLVSSLVAHQAAAQYAYEDRIAALGSALDREQSRAMLDRHKLDTVLHDLEARSLRLEARASLLDRLVDQAPGHRGSAATSALPARTMLAPADADPDIGPQAGPVEPAPGLRLDDSDASSPAAPADLARTGADKHAALVVPDRPDERRIGRMLSDVEDKQGLALAALRGPVLQSVQRMRTALSELGLGGVGPADVGGPFEPLSTKGLSFEQDADLLRASLEEADRLKGLVAKVPLRKPFGGALEVTSPFGPRLDPFYGRLAMHTGTDFRAAYGASVHATAAGTVTIAGSDGGYGTMVEIDHGNGLSTRYAHLSGVLVAPGEKVAAGAVIGTVGSSGRATGPHLHYETRIDGEPVDPERFLKAGAGLFGSTGAAL